LSANGKDHREVYENLLKRHIAALRRLAWSYARDTYEDLFQEIAMALWTALPRFRGDCSERTWIHRVAHNTAISFVANSRRRSTHEQTGHELPEHACLVNPEKEAFEQERRTRLWKAVQELPLADRQLVVMYLEGLSAVEIEAVAGMSSGAVATRLTRARKKLMEKVRGEKEDRL
jgi:RNA polymerase sigma-70 factor (ECF subfamily)